MSAHLSPLARRPLLDGLAPPAPYRWVNPPPELADVNEPPTAGRFTLALDASGAAGGAFTTPDAQVTIIVPNDAIAPSTGQRSVSITIEPLDPATLGRAPRSLVVLGNAVRVEATYEPGGDPVKELLEPIEVVLTYPFVLSDSGEHTLLVSEEGDDWSKVRTADHQGPSQAIGSMGSLGYVMVAGRRLENAPSPPPSTGAPNEGIPLAVIGAGVIAVLLVLAIIFGGRGERRQSRNRR
jgi:hypothetical protein